MTNCEKKTAVVTGCMGASSLLVCEVHMLGLARGHYTPQGFTENGCAAYITNKNFLLKALSPLISPGSWQVFI